MKHTLKKGVLLLVLAVFAVGGVFAQRVGDTVTISGSSQEYRVQEVRDGRVVLQAVSTTFRVGDRGPGGGIIFYHDPRGFRVEGYSGTTGSFAAYTAYYLEAAPEDSRSASWVPNAYTGLISGVTTFESNSHSNARSIGNGRKDTMAIIAARPGLNQNASGAAINAARETFGGKNDWFLPSLGELNLLFQNRAIVGNLRTGPSAADTYWSSSQVNDREAWRMDFHRGDGRQQTFSKAAGTYVRAIRAF